MHSPRPYYDRSLLTVDISGAQPKSRNGYMSRLLPNQISYDQQYQLSHLQHPQADLNFGRRRYQHDFHHFANLCVPQGENYFIGTQKKHYSLHQQGDIKHYKVLENHYDVPKYINNQIGQINADRVLATNDIEGTMPGSHMSQAVRNQAIAQRLRNQQDESRYTRNRQLYLNNIVQSAEIKPASRQKCFSVEYKPQNTPTYDYMNKQQKFPPLEQMKFDPISNKFQLRPIERNYLETDYQRTMQLLYNKNNHKYL